MSKGTVLDTEGIRAAYQDVRDDSSETSWAIFKYKGTSLCHDSSGVDYNDFKGRFTDDERGFGYIRCTTGDELSKRWKFALITWIGANVSPLPRAKMSTDKSLVKEIITSYAAEIQPGDSEEMEEENVKAILRKAGGANYGTGGVDLSAPPENSRPAEEVAVTMDTENSVGYDESEAYTAEDPFTPEDNGVVPETEYSPEEMENDEQ
jgi:hypothetical protein